MVMKYDSIMADWLGGSGEHQPGRARAPHSHGTTLKVGRCTELQKHCANIMSRPEWKLENTASGAMQGGVHTVHYTAPVSPCCAGWWCRVMRAGWARCWAGAPPRPVMSIVKCNNAVTCTGPADTAYSATFYNTTQHNTEITQHNTTRHYT